LGRYWYLGLLRLASVVVGNSSSGLTETPAFRIPCVDIGSRQKGRLRSTNVISVGYEQHAIEEAIKTCLFDLKFREQVLSAANPYDSGDAAGTIARRLAEIQTGKTLLQKKNTY